MSIIISTLLGVASGAGRGPPDPAAGLPASNTGGHRGRHPGTRQSARAASWSLSRTPSPVRRGGRLGAPVLFAALEIELDVLPVGCREEPAAHLLQRALEVAQAADRLRVGPVDQGERLAQAAQQQGAPDRLQWDAGAVPGLRQPLVGSREGCLYARGPGQQLPHALDVGGAAGVATFSRSDEHPLGPQWIAWVPMEPSLARIEVRMTHIRLRFAQSVGLGP